MKLSTETLGVLTNFQTINPSIVIKPGALVKTLSDDKCILAEAKLEEDFPSTFGIFDLAQFINNITTLGQDNTEIDFEDQENVAKFKNNGFSVSFRACKPELITAPPEKELPMDDITLEVVLKGEEFRKFIKLANMNDLKIIALENREGKVYITANDGSDTSNGVEHLVGETDKPDTSIRFMTNHMKMIPGTYTVTSTPSFAKFVSQNGNMKYYIVAQSA